MSSNRAAGAFLANIPGPGPALQAAFPVIGAVAFAGVIVDVVQEMIKLGTEASETAADLGTGWLDGAVAEMTGLKDAIKQVVAEQKRAWQRASTSRSLSSKRPMLRW